MSKVRDIAYVVAVRMAMSAVVWWGGFRAVSDDDFARIVHAQEFALSPALDPTGTSWLPFPFWLTGSVMMVFGTSVTVARAVAFALGVVSSVLIYAAARMLIEDRRGALWGALLATVFPWSARLGVAAVPELPAAALSVFALATLAKRDHTLRLGGAVALTIACLCRYEPWVLAGGFAVFTALDARRHGGRWLVAALIAVVGPLAWVAHNHMHHGDALHFLARVAAYKHAVGGASVLELYPLFLVREEPELCIAAMVLLVAGRSFPHRFVRPTACLAALVMLLSLAALRGGAPTHHVGRAVLVIWITVAIGVGEGARRALRSPQRARFAAFVLALMLLGAFILRPWYARLDSFITRRHEVAIGNSVAPELASGRAMVEARDYGFFAIQAGTGVPNRVVLDRDVDPRRARRPSSFTSAAAIRTRARELDADLVIGHRTAVTASLGTPEATSGPWGAWRITPTGSD